MPRGTYTFTSGRVEAFSCAPGPAGWRYVSETLDLACDKAFRPVRFVVGGWAGGGGRLDDGTGVLRSASQGGGERVSRADVLLTGSPGSWVAAVRQVAPPAAGPIERTLDALTLVGTRPEVHRLRLARVGATREQADLGDLLVETWQVETWRAGTGRAGTGQAQDHATGSSGVLHIAGDVVIFAQRLPGVDGDVEITDLVSPPSFR